jgi:hypothetical protein
VVVGFREHLAHCQPPISIHSAEAGPGAVVGLPELVPVPRRARNTNVPAVERTENQRWINRTVVSPHGHILYMLGFGIETSARPLLYSKLENVGMPLPDHPNDGAGVPRRDGTYELADPRHW